MNEGAWLCLDSLLGCSGFVKAWWQFCLCISADTGIWPHVLGGVAGEHLPSSASVSPTGSRQAGFGQPQRESPGKGPTPACGLDPRHTGPAGLAPLPRHSTPHPAPISGHSWEAQAGRQGRNLKPPQITPRRSPSLLALGSHRLDGKQVEVRYQIWRMESSLEIV